MRKAVSSLIQGGNKFQVAVRKATSSKEEAPKRKHVRAIILRAVTQRTTISFYQELTQRPVVGKLLVSYKCLLVLHSLMQEGPNKALVEAYQQRHLMQKIESKWSSERNAYAQLTTSYARLLMDKVTFHRAHPEWALDKDGAFDVDAFVRNHPNPSHGYCFETMTHIQDMLEATLHHGRLVVKALGMDQRVTSVGTNDLIASNLIPLVVEAYGAYQAIVWLLRLLHEEDADPSPTEFALDRFYKQYHPLRRFLQDAAGIDYVVKLVHVMQLPEDPPVFHRPNHGRRRRPRSPSPERVAPEPEPEPEPLRSRWDEIDQFAQQSPSQAWSQPLAALFSNTSAPTSSPPPPVVVPELVKEPEPVTVPQGPTTVGGKTAEELADMIRRERERAKGIFAHKDAEIAKWQAFCRKVNDENASLQAELDALLRENAKLRERIAAAKQSHADDVHAIRCKHVDRVRRRIDGASRAMDKPMPSDRAIPYTAPTLLASLEPAVRQVANELITAASAAGSGTTTPLLAAINSCENPVTTLLERSHAVLLSSHDKSRAQGLAMASKTVGAAFNHALLTIRGGEDSTDGLESRLEGAIASWSQQVGDYVTFEQSTMLTHEEGMETYRVGQQRLDAIVARLQAALDASNSDGAPDEGDSGVVRRALRDASNAIVRSTLALVQACADRHGKQAHAFAAAGQQGLAKGEADNIQRLAEAAERVAKAVERLLAVAQACAQGGQQDWSQLSDAAESVEAASLALVSLCQDASNGPVHQAHGAVTRAIRQLIAALEAHAAHAQAMRDAEEQDRAMESIAEEDRAHIVEQRAALWRLRAELKERDSSLTSLVQAEQATPTPNAIFG